MSLTIRVLGCAAAFFLVACDGCNTPKKAAVESKPAEQTLESKPESGAGKGDKARKENRERDGKRAGVDLGACGLSLRHGKQVKVVSDAAAEGTLRTITLAEATEQAEGKAAGTVTVSVIERAGDAKKVGEWIRSRYADAQTETGRRGGKRFFFTQATVAGAKRDIVLLGCEGKAVEISAPAGDAALSKLLARTALGVIGGGREGGCKPREVTGCAFPTFPTCEAGKWTCAELKDPAKKPK